ncbi:unnamed protein product [Protopolystoma xenopodis]|uniref:Uncharacterized protein n=1 Tax=Protopolystoma xenopodis TaxID=117903 RepID=A0A3S5A3C1_9PLAT|nr:unnamed protein product [Protopolystoma xenopodis]
MVGISALLGCIVRGLMGLAGDCEPAKSHILFLHIISSPTGSWEWLYALYESPQRHICCVVYDGCSRPWPKKQPPLGQANPTVVLTQASAALTMMMGMMIMTPIHACPKGFQVDTKHQTWYQVLRLRLAGIPSTPTPKAGRGQPGSSALLHRPGVDGRPHPTMRDHPSLASLNEPRHGCCPCRGPGGWFRV